MEQKEEQNLYKSHNTSNNNMIPGDPKGSPDEFFMEDTPVFIDDGFLSKISKKIILLTKEDFKKSKIE